MENLRTRNNAIAKSKYRYFFFTGLLLTTGASIFGRFYEGPYTEAIAITAASTGCALLFAFMFLSRREKE